MTLKTMQPYLAVHVIGDKVLQTSAAPIAEITDQVREMAQRMIATMLAFNGIGLAAPQVGISLRLVTLGVPTRGNGNTPGEAVLLPQMPLVLINPRIISHCEETTMHEEGCLSVPSIYGHVERPSVVVLEALKLDGSRLVIECGGLLACCIQHEIDHLNGTLFVKRVISDEQYEIRRKADELKRRYGMMNYIRTSP